MKAVVAAFNQEKALVGAFSVITNLRIIFGCNFLKHATEGIPGVYTNVRHYGDWVREKMEQSQPR